jgi:hypothetical protein
MPFPQHEGGVEEVGESAPMNYLSACAILKDENVYLPEWIAYHRAVGVEHFYLYDNESAVPVATTLGPEVNAGLVTVLRRTGRAQQGPAYEDCLARYRNDSVWIAFIDIDEFIVPKMSVDLRLVVKDYERFGGVGFNWQTFGSSGLLRRPEGLQIEAFTRRSIRRYSMNNHIKSIVRPTRAVKYRDPHSFSYNESRCVNEKFSFVEGAFNEPPLHEVAQINHYMIRSREEYEQKARRGAADGSKKTVYLLETWDKEMNVEEDRDILRFAEATKKILGGVNP